jgi:hypothetical protein
MANHCDGRSECPATCASPRHSQTLDREADGQSQASATVRCARSEREDVEAGWCREWPQASHSDSDLQTGRWKSEDEFCENRRHFFADGKNVAQASVSLRGAKSYRDGSELHLHVEVHPSLTDHDVRHMCAVDQRPPDEPVRADQLPVRDEELWSGFLSRDKDRVEGLVFVPVIEVPEDGERVVRRVL